MRDMQTILDELINNCRVDSFELVSSDEKEKYEAVEVPLLLFKYIISNEIQDGSSEILTQIKESTAYILSKIPNLQSGKSENWEQMCNLAVWQEILPKIHQYATDTEFDFESLNQMKYSSEFYRDSLITTTIIGSLAAIGGGYFLIDSYCLSVSHFGAERTLGFTMASIGVLLLAVSVFALYRKQYPSIQQAMKTFYKKCEDINSRIDNVLPISTMDSQTQTKR
jgi:hypothetical protein